MRALLYGVGTAFFLYWVVLVFVSLAMRRNPKIAPISTKPICESKRAKLVLRRLAWIALLLLLLKLVNPFEREEDGAYWILIVCVVLGVLSYPTDPRNDENTKSARFRKLLRALRWLLLPVLLYLALVWGMDRSDGWRSFIYFLFAVLCYFVVRPSRGEYKMHPRAEELQDLLLWLGWTFALGVWILQTLFGSVA